MSSGYNDNHSMRRYMRLQVISPLASEWDNCNMIWCIMSPEYVHRSLEIVDMRKVSEVTEDMYLVAEIIPFPFRGI